MHDTALEIGQLFFEVYAKQTCTIVELGSLDVNGALRTVAPQGASYVGLDMARGPGVDVVIKPDMPLPLQTDCADIVVSSSMFEHDDFFWNTFLEIVRIVRPGGAIYINSPSNGPYHRYPVDNWRFYPDAGKALQRWGRSQGHPLTLTESFVADRKNDVWNDFVAIFVKAETIAPGSIAFLSDRIACTNAWRIGMPEIMLRRDSSEDMILQERASRPNREPAAFRLPLSRAHSLKSNFRSWLGRKRDKKTGHPSLVPHVSIAFPKLTALLVESSEATPALKDEIGSLLESYARRWPFDEKFYLRTYGDVVVALQRGQIASAFHHFCSSGYAEGRLPVDPEVDPIWYLETYPDVSEAIERGLVESADHHFRKDGYREGRYPSRLASLAKRKSVKETAGRFADHARRSEGAEPRTLAKKSKAPIK